MGIKDVKDMYKAKWLGISWQILSLLSATIIGLIAKLIYSNIVDPEQIFIVLTKSLFSDFSSTFILCVIIGATITVMDSQILVVATSLSEDLYKKIIRKDASSNELLFVTRASIFIVAIAACIIALRSDLSIMSLTKYAWFGLGATFSPLILFSLYGKTVNFKGALAGLISGCSISAIWPFTFPLSDTFYNTAFFSSCLLIKVFSFSLKKLKI